MKHRAHWAEPHCYHLWYVVEQRLHTNAYRATRRGLVVHSGEATRSSTNDAMRVAKAVEHGQLWRARWRRGRASMNGGTHTHTSTCARTGGCAVMPALMQLTVATHHSCFLDSVDSTGCVCLAGWHSLECWSLRGHGGQHVLQCCYRLTCSSFGQAVTWSVQQPQERLLHFALHLVF